MQILYKIFYYEVFTLKYVGLLLWKTNESL
jgi:hypothetical protein